MTTGFAQIQNLQSEIHDLKDLTHLSTLFRLKRSRTILYILSIDVNQGFSDASPQTG